MCLHIKAPISWLHQVHGKNKYDKRGGIKRNTKAERTLVERINPLIQHL